MAGTTLVDRALIRLSGDDARGFLQDLVTSPSGRMGDVLMLELSCEQVARLSATGAQ